MIITKCDGQTTKGYRNSRQAQEFTLPLTTYVL